MLTITGIVLEQDKENEFEEKIKASKLHDWPLFSANWQDIHEIAVPDLTPREKLAINQFLPLKEDDSIDPSKLKFKINRNEIKNQRALNNYVKYYRYIPNFQRLAF